MARTEAGATPRRKISKRPGVQPATPTDLRQEQLRSGRKLATVYRVLVTGIEGTPMPSFAETLTEEQRWELVAYVAQLRRNHATGNRP